MALAKHSHEKRSFQAAHCTNRWRRAFPTRPCSILAALAVAGAFAAPAHAADLAYLQCLVDATPPGGWVKASTGAFSSAWATAAQGGVSFGSYSSPAGVVRAWSSVAWDSTRGNLILWGGGHANYVGNEVYLWQGSTGKWTRGSLPTRIEHYAGAVHLTVDNITPQSAHTYDNNVYVPGNDRFVTFGGAAFNTGGAFENRDLTGVPTAAGPWMWDPSKADPNRVGGADGSGYTATSGGHMWTNQRGKWVGGGNPYGHVGSHSATRTEAGKDVIYVTGGVSAGWHPLYRYELGNVAQGQPGRYNLVGLSSNAPTYQGAATIDTRRNLYIHTSATGGWRGLGVWDLSRLPTQSGTVADCTGTPGQSHSCLIDRYIALVYPNGAAFSVNQHHGIGYDSATGKIHLWDGSNRGTVWETQAQYLSDGSLSPVWTVTPRASTTFAQPMGTFENGVLGKWNYVAELGAYITLDQYEFAARDAAVWLYKPVDAPVGSGTTNPEECRAIPAGNNYAAAAHGTTASASSTYSAAYAVASVLDGESAGANWAAAGGWNDATHNVQPDWLQIVFKSPKTIDRVVVYTMQDNYNAPVEPDDTMTFNQWGITDFSVEGWNGSAWVTLGDVTGNRLVKRSVAFVGFTTDRIRIVVRGALGGYSRITEVEAFGTAGPGTPPTRSNVASASAGAVAAASSTYNARYPVAAVNNDDRTGAGWESGGGWNDATAGAFPDAVHVRFDGYKTIDQVDVYTLQDNYYHPIEPLDTTTFSAYGITDFRVEGWTGSAWTVLGSVSGNTLVKRRVTFAPYTTDRIRVVVTGALAGHSRITEIEAYGTAAAGPINVAAVAAGATASASSTHSHNDGYRVATVQDGNRSGLGWGSGGGWNDATADAFPDWVDVAFGRTRTIDRIVVYTLQDNWAQPVEPTDETTFSAFGITDFAVEAWTGSAWIALGTVTGNNRVERTLVFPAVTTDRIRVTVTNAPYSYSRIVEIEAWGQ